MTKLVTGGAGFIGANFVLVWLRSRDEPVLNIDKLTTASNRECIARLNNSGQVGSVHVDSRRPHGYQY